MFIDVLTCFDLVLLLFNCSQNMAYYKISHVDGRISNPEQRIASDVPRFCSELSELVQDDLTAVADGLLYTWRLCSYASPKYVFWILVVVFLYMLCELSYNPYSNFLNHPYCVLGLCIGSRGYYKKLLSCIWEINVERATVGRRVPAAPFTFANACRKYSILWGRNKRRFSHSTKV